jgi:succinyl-diaminopimelate desuccinylase
LLKKRVVEILDSYDFEYSIDWQHSGGPFLTPKGRLLDACAEAISKVKSIEPELSTSGGTSDGRFIAQMGTEVVEIGPINETIHQVNECVSVQDLDDLTRVYQQVLTNILL